ncbi:MAG: hypothetical protein JST79_04165 [Acidobacteria bacterium]|nr:hypothetical protein [Acidobacteriota bacterium]
MSLRVSSKYAEISEKARWGHTHGRSLLHLGPADVEAGRLYSYGFRTQTIGAFHGARTALLGILESGVSKDAESSVQQAIILLSQLEARAMDEVPTDARVVISTLYFYDLWIHEVLGALDTACARRAHPTIELIRQHFVENIQPVVAGNGIYVTNDTDLPEQGSFTVPNLNIFIRPIVYGDYHSWNTGHLSPEQYGVAVHRHHLGAEIHLGFSHVKGETILGDAFADVREGYAMPIPPNTNHGFRNTSGEEHIVPFIFGSQRLGGWGVFFDVEPQGDVPVQRAEHALDSAAMNHSVFLDREIAKMAQGKGAERTLLIPAERAGNCEIGGLELALTRTGTAPMELTGPDYRIVSVQHGAGKVRIGESEVEVRARDHFGIPADMPCTLTPNTPIVFLDSRILPLT